MTTTDQLRMTRMRRQYEWGRWRAGFNTLAVTLPMLALACAASGITATTAITGVLLVALCVVVVWLGRGLGAGVWPGLMAGAAPLLLPVLMRTGQHCCVAGRCWSSCMVGCVLGGAVAGVILGRSVAARASQRGEVFLSAVLIATLAGSMGCALIGVAGVAGMLIAMGAASVPMLVVARARA
jgi:hypothetical protein